jgi:penicillin-binding protein 1C
LRRYGPIALGSQMNDAGIVFPHSAASYGLTLGLGAAEVDLLSLTRAAAAFARGGRTLDVKLLADDTSGETTGTGSVDLGLPEAPREPRMVSEATAFLVTDVLRDNEARAGAFGRQSALKFPFPVAAKTGTSQGFHDNWVIGWTDRFTVGVWVGNFDRTPLRGATGVTGAGPIFHSVVLAAEQRFGHTVAGALTRGEAEVPVALRQVPSTATESGVEYEWAMSAPKASARVAVPLDLGGKLRLGQPSHRSQWLIDPTVPRAGQRLPLRVSGGKGPYDITVDNVEIGSSTGLEDGPTWPLVPGRHRACVTDSTGIQACSDFSVR